MQHNVFGTEWPQETILKYAGGVDKDKEGNDDGVKVSI